MRTTFSGKLLGRVLLGTALAWIGLAACSTSDTTVHVAPASVEDQAIVLSTSMLSVAEGTSGTFDVSLKRDPGTTVTVHLAATNMALQIDPSSITFTGGPDGNWSTPVTVTVSAPIDSNDVSETAIITASGAGAATPATFTSTVTDSTVVKQYGFPTAFPSAVTVLTGQVVAYRITVDSTMNLDSFGVYIPAGTGDFRMALYANELDAPGVLIAQMPVRQAIGVDPFNIGNIPDVKIPVGTYWIAFRAAQTTAVGFSDVGTGPTCVRNTDIPNLDNVWPISFGSATCTTNNLMNLFINTYRQ